MSEVTTWEHPEGCDCAGCRLKRAESQLARITEERDAAMEKLRRAIKAHPLHCKFPQQGEPSEEHPIICDFATLMSLSSVSASQSSAPSETCSHPSWPPGVRIRKEICPVCVPMAPASQSSATPSPEHVFCPRPGYAGPCQFCGAAEPDGKVCFFDNWTLLQARAGKDRA